MKQGVRFGLFTVCVFFILVSAAAAAKTDQIGFVDAQVVLDNTKAGKQAKEAMEEYVKSRQKVLDIDADEIKGLEEDLSKQKDVLSREALRAKEQEYQKKVIKFESRARQLNREIQEKKEEVLMGFRKNLEKVLKKIAEQDNYLMIFDREEGGVLLFSKEGLDLTQQAIKEYDKMFP